MRTVVKAIAYHDQNWLAGDARVWKYMYIRKDCIHVHVNMEGRLLRLHLWEMEQKPHVRTVPGGREMVEKSENLLYTLPYGSHSHTHAHVHVYIHKCTCMSTEQFVTYT